MPKEDARLAEIRRQIGMGQRQMAALELIMAERERAEAKFPDQHLEQGTGPAVLPFDHPRAEDYGSGDLRMFSTAELADVAKAVCQASDEDDPDTWLKVILEEALEYAEAFDPEHVKAELVQLGAMVLRALEDIVALEEVTGE